MKTIEQVKSEITIAINHSDRDTLALKSGLPVATIMNLITGVFRVEDLTLIQAEKILTAHKEL